MGSLRGSMVGDCLQYFIPDWPCVPQKFKGGSGEDGKPRTVNIFLGFFFMVNFVLGTGFLGIPYGFVHGGLLAGVVTLTVISVMAWSCAIWEVEAMARAQVMMGIIHVLLLLLVTDIALCEVYGHSFKLLLSCHIVYLILWFSCFQKFYTQQSKFCVVDRLVHKKIIDPTCYNNGIWYNSNCVYRLKTVI